MASERMKIELPSTGRQLTHVTYSPDGRRLLTMTDDAIAQVRNAETGQILVAPTGAVLSGDLGGSP